MESEPANPVLRFVTLNGQLTGFQNIAYLASIIVVLVLWLIPNWLAFWFMMGGHSGIQSSEISDTGERIAYAGFAVFLMMWPGILSVLSFVSHLPELVELCILLTTITLAVLMTAAEQVDRVTYLCRHGYGFDSDNEQKCKDSRGVYLTGIVITIVVHVVILVVGVLVKRMLTVQLGSYASGAEAFTTRTATPGKQLGGYPEIGAPDGFTSPYASHTTAPSFSSDLNPAANAEVELQPADGMYAPSAGAAGLPGSFCTRCGHEWEATDKFCRGCGFGGGDTQA